MSSFYEMSHSYSPYHHQVPIDDRGDIETDGVKDEHSYDWSTVPEPSIQLSPLQDIVPIPHDMFASPFTPHQPLDDHSIRRSSFSFTYGSLQNPPYGLPDNAPQAGVFPFYSTTPPSPYQALQGGSSASPASTTSSPYMNTPSEGSLILRPSSPEAHSYDRESVYRERLRQFRSATTLPSMSAMGPYIPQLLYKPQTRSDRRRYIEDTQLEMPIYFQMEHPQEFGESLLDALQCRVGRLVDHDQPVFENCGPSVSIRLEWPGYAKWSKQIPSRDFRSPPGPITKAKLAKGIAKCVQRFMEEGRIEPFSDETDTHQWRVGPDGIRLENIFLVSLHHVSMGSWQPQLRLRHPLQSPVQWM